MLKMFVNTSMAPTVVRAEFSNAGCRADRIIFLSVVSLSRSQRRDNSVGSGALKISAQLR